MSEKTERANRGSATDYGFLHSDWSSDWKAHRDLLGVTVGIAVANGPGLFWLHAYVEALRNAESAAYWYGQTPTGELSVTAQYGVAIVLAALWFGMVLATFKKPLKETVREIRR